MKKPNPHESLQVRIAALRASKALQEQALSESFESIVHKLSPSSLAKNALHDLADDREVQESATGAALKFGSRFVVFKVIGRFGGLFGAVAAALAGSLSDQYVDRATPKLLHVIGQLFKRKKTAESPELENVHMHI